MPTVLGTTYTLLEQMKGQVNGSVLRIAEVLEEHNPFFKVLPWVKTNDGRGHVVQIRASVPSASIRRYNQGWKKAEATSRQDRFGSAIFVNSAQADRDLIDDSPEPRKERIKRANGAIIGVNNTVNHHLIYGSKSDDAAGINGLATLNNDLSMENVHDFGGSGADTTSLYLLEPGEDKVYLIHPEGKSNMGVRHIDHGLQKAFDEDGNEFWVYEDEFNVDCGLAIEDPRAVQRIVNIEALNGTDAELEAVLAMIIRARLNLPSRGRGSAIICDVEMKARFDILAMNKANAFYTAKDPFGRPVTMFQETEIHTADSILSTEVALVA